MTQMILVLIMLLLSFWNVSESEEYLKNEDCKTCGYSKGKKIIKGNLVAPMRKYPWIVLLKVGGSVCTGALISSDFVLTAAHCVYVVNVESMQKLQVKHRQDEKTLYRLREPSEIILKLVPETQGGIEKNLTVSKVFPHPKYPRNSSFVAGMYDIALLKLEKKLTCGPVYPVPICVHQPDMEEAYGKIFIAGFGRHNESKIYKPTLREGVVTATSDKGKCGSKDLTFTICALGLESNQTACNGDSGSSAFRKFGNSWYSVGVSSGRKSKLCSPLEPSYFTRTAAHFKWIQKNVKNLPVPQDKASE